MKKFFIILTLTYLLATINSSAIENSSNENVVENEKILKIGVLLPLSGKFQDTVREINGFNPQRITNLLDFWANHQYLTHRKSVILSGEPIILTTGWNLLKIILVIQPYNR